MVVDHSEFLAAELESGHERVAGAEEGIWIAHTCIIKHLWCQREIINQLDAIRVVEVGIADVAARDASGSTIFWSYIEELIMRTASSVNCIGQGLHCLRGIRCAIIFLTVIFNKIINDQMNMSRKG